MLFMIENGRNCACIVRKEGGAQAYLHFESTTENIRNGNGQKIRVVAQFPSFEDVWIDLSQSVVCVGVSNFQS